VGTEAAAVAALKANSKAFKYPPEGFVERVEYTLLYSMLNEPKVYPENVVKEHIAAEDFNQYLAIKDAHGQFAASASSAGNNGSNSEERVSYAQLSALLALSAEKFPPKNDSAASDSSSDNQSISEKLCKVILQCVVRYAEEHGLDRKAEIQELLGPVEKHAMKRNNKAALYQVLPFYVGYAATIVTANPLPMLAGAAMMSAGQDDMYEENKNVQSIANESEKRADIEKTGLLDETDDW